jgi:deazaflavin-dependent oxidoreductase (nitroreductase family)
LNRRLLTALSRAHVALFRASGGRLGGRIRSGAPVLLLTSTGRRSGTQRTTPLLYLEDGGRYVVIGSVGGAPKHPAWYLNLLVKPEATIEVGRRKLAVTAGTASAEERARLWPLAVRIYPGYENYQAKTIREIPVVILAPHRAAANASGDHELVQ